MPFKQKTVIVLIFFVLFFVLPNTVSADVEGSVKNFFIDSEYDWQGREQVSALLHKVSDEAYFYIEEDWYNNLTEGEKEKAKDNIEMLSQEFSEVIYPQLTENYGPERNPGIDSDKRITVLFHRMPYLAAGYFKNQDETSRLQNSESNEREMVYLNSHYLLRDIIKSYLAHEFTHLITFNQKEQLKRVGEEVWLNEARAEYAATLLGYDTAFPNSNLEKRIDMFLKYPSDSLTEWNSQAQDYGVIAAFVNYLVDHYGKEVLIDSLQSAKVGIPSIEQALADNRVRKEFWQVFADWAVAVFLNDCQKNSKHCYKSRHLQYIKISPSLIYLPPEQEAELSLTNSTTYWAGNWYRILGGADKLEVVFQGESQVEFKVPYVLCKTAYECSVGFLELDEAQTSVLAFEGFNEEYASLTLIPFVVSKTSGFNGEEERFPFSIKATASPESSPIPTPENSKQELIARLKAQIAEIQAKIAQLQAQLVELSAQQGQCLVIAQDLYLGMRGKQVECLQQFLFQQGPEIYPEAYVTGYFGTLTQKAVMRFQEKHASEILHPLGITQATGYVGSSTRAKINQLTGVGLQQAG